MKTKILPSSLLLFATLNAANVWAALKEGDLAPDFKAVASLAGKSLHYSLHDALKKGHVVLYFYPSAYTAGCNIQAHSFAQAYEKFQSAGASVVGVSLDNIRRLNDFSADPDYCAGKFPVASDVDGKIAKSYDLVVAETEAGRKDTRGAEIDHGRAERSTFIVTSEGKIYAVIGGLSAEKNVAKALAAVQKLAAEKVPRR